MTKLMNYSAAVRTSGRLALGAALIASIGACSSILDVKNPNNIAESSLSNPAAANAEASGVLASTVRMLGGISNVYGVTTDELDWIGSRDAYRDLDTGAIGNYVNEYTDGAFPNVAEARFLGDATIARLEAFDKDKLLTSRIALARTYLYTAITYATIADIFDDFAFSNKTVSAAPVGRANMSKLYDTAIDYLNKGLVIAEALNDNTTRYQILSWRARTKFAKGVWTKITPKGQTPANPLVSDAGAVADANAALALSPGDTKFNLVNNLESTAGINIWYEVNNRKENQVGRAYFGPAFPVGQSSACKTCLGLIDPISGVEDPTVKASTAAFIAFGGNSGTLWMSSNRELRLILAEASLAGGNTAEFISQINTVRALDGKPAFVAQISNTAMLAYERKAQLYLMRRRLMDMYRFGQKAGEWTASPNFESAVSVPGLLFPIPNIERLSNTCIVSPGSCK
jgi:hypothetical protein